VLDGIDLGRDVLEVGPGPGITTEYLLPRAGHLTCVEIDRELAEGLGLRMAGLNVRVVRGDATALPLRAGTFDSAVSLTMLHHVPSAALQDRLLAEVARVLRPNGLFVGVDSLAGPIFRMLHAFDTMAVVNPRTFAARLEAAGFTGPEIDARAREFRFRARRVRCSAGAPDRA
jgi:SAM-dependent methyltransferase